MDLSIRVDTRRFTKQLTATQRKQIPFATRNAMNKVAKQAVADLQQEMKAKLDRPVPWTLNAFYFKPSTPRDLSVYIGTREYAGSGRPAWKYLSPEVYGGARAKKGFELKMAAVAGNQFVVPTPYTPLDAYGNISRGFITQVLSRLGLMAEVGSKQNITALRSRRLWKQKKTVHQSGHVSEFFIKRDTFGSKRAIGLYKLVSKGVVQEVLTFSPVAPVYQPRLAFRKSIDGTVARMWAPEFQAALRHALATARPTR